MVLHTLPYGDAVHRFDDNIVIPFAGKRKVLSTSPHNGGYREDLTAVFNHDGRLSLGVDSHMKAPTYREHMMITIQEIGLDVSTAAGMETAAHMENVAIAEHRHDTLSVTAIVTGGIETNGGRVGDPASWMEQADVPQEHRLGTINIMLAIDADLSPGCMARALVICTEAKTAAIQELLAESRYSRGLATGSGTDGTIIIADAQSPRYLTDAGKHSKLGELIGLAAKAAVKEALAKQTRLCPAYQHNAIRRLHRFGISEGGVYQRCMQTSPDSALHRAVFAESLERHAAQGQSVLLASFLAHAIDQMDWGLITVDEALETAALLLRDHAARHVPHFTPPSLKAASPDEAVAAIIEAWMDLAIAQVLAEAAQRFTRC